MDGSGAALVSSLGNVAVSGSTINSTCCIMLCPLRLQVPYMHERSEAFFFVGFSAFKFSGGGALERRAAFHRVAFGVAHLYAGGPVEWGGKAQGLGWCGGLPHMHGKPPTDQPVVELLLSHACWGLLRSALGHGKERLLKYSDV